MPMAPFTSSYVYAEDQPTVFIDPTGLGAISNTCGSFECWVRDGIPNQAIGAGVCVVYCVELVTYRADLYVSVGCCGIAPGRIHGQSVPGGGGGSAGEPAEESAEIGVCYYVCVGRSTDLSTGEESPTYGVGAPGLFIGERRTIRIPGS
jgi:hypothetical protein